MLQKKIVKYKYTLQFKVTLTIWLNFLMPLIDTDLHDVNTK